MGISRWQSYCQSSYRGRKRETAKRQGEQDIENRIVLHVHGTVALYPQAPNDSRYVSSGFRSANLPVIEVTCDLLPSHHAMNCAGVRQAIDFLENKRSHNRLRPNERLNRSVIMNANWNAADCLHQEDVQCILSHFVTFAYFWKKIVQFCTN